MTAATTPKPPTSIKPPADEGSRQQEIERLRSEGRAIGHAPLGFRLAGKRGNRRLVPDDRQRWLMQLVADWRDQDGMSWDEISDALEKHVAKTEGRKPLSRAFRRGTTKKTVWRMYQAFKRLEAEGEPVPTHRRCRKCRRSLPLDRFTALGKTCFTCRITRPLREFDERVAATSADLIGKRHGETPRSASAEETSHRIQRVIRNVLSQIKRHPKAPETADAINGLLQALTTESRASVPVEAMTDSQLQGEIDRQLRSELRPLLLEIQAEFALLDLNEPTGRTETKR